MTANDNRPERDQRRGPSNSRANTAALVAIVVVAAVVFWVVSAMREHNAVQDCLDSGRKDCVETDTR